MRANFWKYASGIKRAVFEGSKKGFKLGSATDFFKRALITGTPGYGPLFPAAVGVAAIWGIQKGGSSVMQSRGNIDLYRGLYTDRGDNIMASGKRGIDTNVGGTRGIVQGLHSNRRRY